MIMDETIIKGKITQIIKDKDKENYMLPHELMKSDKYVIVIEVKEQKGIVDALKCFFWRDEFVKVLLSDNADFEIDEIVSLKVKPYWIKTKFYEIDNK